MGQSTTQETILPPPTSGELRLQDIAAQLGEQQLSAIQGYAPFQQQLFSMIPGLGEALARDLGLNIPEGTFRMPTEEERAYQEFLAKGRPKFGGGFVGGGDGGFSPEDWSPSAQALAGTPLESLGGWGAIKEGNDRKKEAARLFFLQELEKKKHKRSVKKWRSRAEEMKAAAEASVEAQKQANSSLGLDKGGWEYGYSPYEADLVNQLAESRLAAGGSDIDAAFKDALRNLGQNLAPSRGMRGYDAPILDRGQLLAMENVRQKGQLSEQVRGQSSEQLLGLSEQAKANRLSLLGFLGNQGLGLGTGDALGAASNLSKERYAQASTTSSQSGLGMSDVGSISSGVGSLISVFSSREIKDVGGRLSGAAVLAKLRKLPIYRWAYKDDPTPHLGPMAEDFRDAFKVGDGKALALVDVMGVLLAAMQGLAQEVHHG